MVSRGSLWNVLHGGHTMYASSNLFFSMSTAVPPYELCPPLGLCVQIAPPAHHSSGAQGDAHTTYRIHSNHVKKPPVFLAQCSMEHGTQHGSGRSSWHVILALRTTSHPAQRSQGGGMLLWLLLMLQAMSLLVNSIVLVQLHFAGISCCCYCRCFPCH